MYEEVRRWRRGTTSFWMLRRWRGSAPIWCRTTRERNPLRKNFTFKPKTSSVILKIL